MTNDIRSWLSTIGLEKFADAFEENEVLVSDLPHLSEDDLQDLGLPLGPRRRLQSAVSAINTDQDDKPSSESEATVTADSETGAQVATDSDAQHRQLTIMFVDLVGSTNIARRVDVEDLRDVNRAYQEAATREIASYSGTVAKYMGDGILAYFGYPIAHENDAERAVHAGLAIVEAVRDLDVRDTSGESLELAVRIGIATGMVIVGDLIGEGPAQERSVVGETPNLAARVEAAARQNTVVVAPSTYRLTRNLFEYNTMGKHVLKGFNEKVELWHARKQANVHSRFHALRSQVLSPLIGRSDEIALLRRRWSMAATGEGHAVILSGEPGIGKSRLTEAIRGEVNSEPHHLLSLQCSPHHSNNPYYPLISQLERTADGSETDTQQKSQQRILESLSCADRIAILSLFGAEDAELSALPPVQRKERILNALVDNILVSSRSSPVLCIIEDVHWADASSLEVLDRLIQAIENEAVLCVVTHRPEFKPRWIGQAGTTLLTLGRMGTRESRQLAEFAFRNSDISQDIIEKISERADGIPLFIEELTQSALEPSGALLNSDPIRQNRVNSNTIPATLLDTLMARLDRSPEAREIAQVASVIGRDFDYSLVETVSSEPPRRVLEGMNQLIDTGLVQATGDLPNAKCRFKHALICDAAYGTLTRDRKKQLHGTLAKQLERVSVETGSTQPVVIAQHYGEAGLVANAISWFENAGQAAISQSAFEEAEAIYQKAVSLCGELIDQDERAEIEFKLQTTLGLIYSTTHGYASTQTEAAYLRAAELSELLKSDRQMFRIQLGLRTFYQVSGRGKEALSSAQRCLDIAKHANDELFLVQAHVALGHTYCVQANFPLAHHHLNEAESRYDPDQHTDHLGLYGLDPGVFGHGIHALISWFLGQTTYAASHIDNAKELSTRLEHMPSVEQAWNAAAHCYLFGRRYVDAMDAITEALAIANRHGFAMRIAMGKVIECAARQGEELAPAEELLKCIEGYEATGGRAFGTFYKTLLVDRLFVEGRYKEAITFADRTLDAGEQMSERWWTSELHRLKGVALAHLDRDQIDIASETVLSGAEIAASQGAAILELRSLTSHAKLNGLGTGVKELERLQRAYQACHDGHDGPDVVEARNLLSELSS
ncbi:MAG: AAA family ATPase [Pseudomonadota bacterium]